jgi:Ca2+-binding EF-hand superfamily protein
MKAEVKLITPELAKELLENNKSNRKISLPKVRDYANQMSAGKWKVNGDCIRISKSNITLDAQHRLLAIIRSGVPILQVFVTDLDDDVFDTIDTGKSRNASDILSIYGAKNNTTVAAGVKKYLLLLNGYKSINTSGITDTNITNSDILNEYKENEELYKTLFSCGSEFYNHNYKTISRSEYIGYYRFFQSKYTDEVIENFFDAYLKKEGNAGLLFEKLLNDKVSKYSMLESEKQKLIVKAFVYFAKGKTINLLKVAKDEKQIEL